MKSEIPFSCDWLKRCVLLLAFSLTPHLSEGGAIEAWVRRYNNVITNSIDGAFKVVVDKTGDVIVAGYTDEGRSGSDMLTIKYSGKDGSLIWKRTYDGPAHSDDFVSALAIDENGNIIITGGSAGDFYTARYSAADG